MINLLKTARVLLQIFGGFFITLTGVCLTLGIMGLSYYGLVTGFIPSNYIGRFQLLILTIIISKLLIFPALRKALRWLLYKIDVAIYNKKPKPKYFL